MRIVPDLQVQVGSFAFHRYSQQIINMHVELSCSESKTQRPPRSAAGLGYYARPTRQAVPQVYFGPSLATMLQMAQTAPVPRIVIIGAGFAGLNAAKSLAGA